ncbi:MAG TPA: hypothetical protein VGF69_03465 [Thermoanaerobaculia bacterium]|jgi:hypothetical protein
MKKSARRRWWLALIALTVFVSAPVSACEYWQCSVETESGRVRCLIRYGPDHEGTVWSLDCSVWGDGPGAWCRYQYLCFDV